MKPITTRAHGFLDYTVATLLIASPWILDFARYGFETWVPVILGAGTIGYSLLTKYELGISEGFTMRTHLGMDMAFGFLLAVSPWLFGFANYIWQPHVVIGIMEIIIALMTSTTPTKQSIHQTEY